MQCPTGKELDAAVLFNAALAFMAKADIYSDEVLAAVEERLIAEAVVADTAMARTTLLAMAEYLRHQARN